MRRKYTIQSEINIIPFLDVLLVLLIIFMIIPSKFIQGFEVNLPNSTKTVNLIDHNKFLLTIEILATGLYNIISNDKNIKNICLDQLNSEICNRICKNPDMVCLLAASETLKYNELIKVLSLLRNVGVHSVGMITSVNTDLN